MAPEFETISSHSNPLIKTLKSLERKKGRAETGLFLAEGARLVQQGLQNGWTCDTLVIAAAAVELQHIQALARSAEAAGARIVIVRDALMEKITHKDNAQSVLASFHQKAPGFDALKPTAGRVGLYVALWEVRDPGNLGTILRTADCAGVSGVILLGTCCDPYSFESVRASMGSIFDLPFVRADWRAFSDWRQRRSLPLAGAVMTGTLRPDKAGLADPVILLLGNEQSGLPQEIEAECDLRLRLPMRGGADSLNLAQAAGILIYEAWRQRDFV